MVLRKVNRKIRDNFGYERLEEVENEEKMKYRGRTDLSLGFRVPSQLNDLNFLVVKNRRYDVEHGVSQCCMYLKRMLELDPTREVNFVVLIVISTT